MENLSYKADIYEGNAPYIHISYHQADKGRVMNILQKLDIRGFRFWLNDGIAPGAQTDEIIAEHIENCDFFIAFLSDNYLGFLDTVDELNYSRDNDKEYLLVYLENTVLPAGIDMRFMRAQSIAAYSMTDDEVSAQLININGASRFYGVADGKLRDTAAKVFNRLEALYPEHKVFALDAVSKDLAKSISELYIKAEYPSAERLMLDYGFTVISVAQARTLRNSIIYQPGFEPEVIKKRIAYITETLTAEYPDGKITDILSKKHPAIYYSLTGLNVWLGYDSVASMLEAYGFTGVSSDSGRISLDHVTVINKIRERYASKARPENNAQLLAENPDLKSALKTLANRSNELFGMSLIRYLKNEGLIVPREKQEKTGKKELRRAELVSEINSLYLNEEHDYGTFEDALPTLDCLVIKKKLKDQIFITDCSRAEETMLIPFGINIIDTDAFAGIGELKKIILPPTVREIRSGAFSDCSSLEEIVFSEGIEKIGDNAFSNCLSLNKISFPASLRYIGNEAFAECANLSEAVFRNIRTNISENAFEGCIFEPSVLNDADASPAEYFELKTDKKNFAKLISYTGDEEIVIIPESINGHPIISVEKGCFKDNSTVKEIYMGDHIDAINGDAFKDCRNLKKIHISDAVTKFTSSAFSGCTSLSEVNIPSAMTEIPRGLFKDSPLTTIFIGKSVTSISPDAFCKGTADFATGIYLKAQSLENLIIDSENEFFSVSGTTLLSKDGKKLIAELGDPVTAIVPEGVEEICEQAFEKISALCEITLPSTLKRIGDKAFAGTNLRHIDIPPEVEIIGTQAFSFCRSLTSADFYDGLKIISQQAFEGCPISDVYIPSTVEAIGNDSFLAISTFQGQIIQRFRVDSANKNIFADDIALYINNSDGLTLVKAYNYGLRLKPGEAAATEISYKIADGTTAVAPHAFARCNNLASVEFPEGLLSIGDMAFWDCSKLKTVRIPESCKNVSPKAFFATPVNLI